MAKVVGVKFKNTAKVYYFAPASQDEVYIEKEEVVVETAKGQEVGVIVFGTKEVPDSEVVQPLKPIVRKITDKDRKLIRENEKRIPEVMEFTQKKIDEHQLDMRLVKVEFSFDGKKLLIYFKAPERVDFRELVKDLAGHFHLRIELRQIGIRDETKLLGGLAPCGRPCCCSGTITDFGKVSVKMAKNQGLHLNPGKISGLCGRLMCCLEYENDYYAEVYKKMPKVGGTVKTPEGEGVVVSNDMLKIISKVKITKPDGSEVYKDFAVKDLQFKKQEKSSHGKNEDDEDINSEEMKKILD